MKYNHNAMINWLQVFFNLLWLLGLALILAAFSYTNWLAHARGVRTRQLLGTLTFQRPFSIGMGLISLGLFFLSRGWLEHVLWAAFTLLFAWQSWGTWRGSQSRPEGSDE
jgi:hypothetical protein